MQSYLTRSRLTKSLLGPAFILLASAGLSYADTVIASNLTAIVAGTGTIYSSGPPQWYAQEFLTGSSSETLSSIMVALGNDSGSPMAAADLVNNSGGLPGSTILTGFFVPTIPTGSPTDLTFTPTASVTLSANTDYWFVLMASGGSSSSAGYQWQYTNTLSPSFPNYAVSSNSGASWSVGTPAGPFLLAANAVPEPSSLVLAAIGLLALGMVVRARRLRTSE